ncbi:hypothetical protein SESBI_03769 [Sesbania bispinosa]|nr:hypothetical protein SESBI_03769 [Sesbania bispinosa]
MQESQRVFPLPSVASVSVPYQPIDFDYQKEEFNGHGVTLAGVGNSYMAKIESRNGSIATIKWI